MTALLKSALRQLQGDGIQLDPVADLEHLVKLYELARSVQNIPAPPEQIALLRPAAAVGDLTLYRLSLGAEMFLRDCVLEWWPEGDFQNLAVVFLLAHARTPEVFWDCVAERRHWWQWRSGQATFRARVERWAARQGATREELLRAANEFLDVGPRAPEPKRREDEPASENLGWLIEMLVREYGHDAEHWLWHATTEEVRYLLDARAARAEREARAASGRGKAPDPDDRFIRALHAFKSYVARVREEKKGPAAA
jgi:hypothetical protein